MNPEESSKVYPLLQAALCKAKGLININKQELYEVLEAGSPGDVGFWSVDSDSRCHETQFEEDFHHGVGVYIAANGYGEDDDLVEAIRGDNKKWADIFAIHVQPVLDACGISEQPDTNIVNQIH